MDINSASPDQVLPLPFHGMTKYPYADPETYPMTAARRAYIDKYNTRLVTTEISSIDTLLTNAADSKGEPLRAAPITIRLAIAHEDAPRSQRRRPRK